MKKVFTILFLAAFACTLHAQGPYIVQNIVLGQDVEKNQWIYIEHDDGLAYILNGEDVNHSAYGLTTTAGSEFDTIQAVINGWIKLDTTLLLGFPYFMDKDNPGEMTDTRPDGNYQQLGFAPQDSFFFVLPQALIKPGFFPVIKEGDQNRHSTTTLADDSKLVAHFKQGKYNVRGHIPYSTANALMGFKYGFNYTGTVIEAAVTVKYIVGGASGVIESVYTSSSLPTSQSITGATSGLGYIDFDIQLYLNDSGDFSFQWAQNTSNGSDLTVMNGAYIEWVKN